MTAAIETPAARLTEQQLGLIFQYNVEAYKTFEKLAESLPNPLAANMFKQFAVTERELRDLIEIKYSASGAARVRVTLGSDLYFQDILEGEMSYRETTEFLIARERTMERRLSEFVRSSSPADRAFLVYVAASKRAHIVELERELELIRMWPDWYRREDAESLLIHGLSAS
jgi:rubrerythrin